MRELLALYLLQLEAKNYSPSTTSQRRKAILELIQYLEKISILSFNNVTSKDLQAFSNYLEEQRGKSNLSDLSLVSLRQTLFSIRRFFIYLRANNYVLSNPAQDLLLTKFRARKEQLLTESEISLLIQQAETSTTIGLRDRALMETLYSTGIRRLEAHLLDLYDIDTREQTLMVRKGKGLKARLLPLTKNAAFWLDEYLIKSRPLLALGLKGHKTRNNPSAITSNALFLSATGARLSYTMLWDIINQYSKKANLVVSPHTLRHCFASHLLKAGFPIQYLKRLLGHSCLDDTQIYLHINQSILNYSIKYLTLD